MERGEDLELFTDEIAAFRAWPYDQLLRLVSTLKFEKFRDPEGSINWRLRRSGMIASGRI